MWIEGVLVYPVDSKTPTDPTFQDAREVCRNYFMTLLCLRPSQDTSINLGKIGRAVECTGLENQQRVKPFEGSNPSSSATLVTRSSTMSELNERKWIDYTLYQNKDKDLSLDEEITFERLGWGAWVDYCKVTMVNGRMTFTPVPQFHKEIDSVGNIIDKTV